MRTPDGTDQTHRPQHQRRPDIQGIRALAVLLVVANHLCGRPTGGFVGVDVFFVISGYLITGLLVREGNRQDTISIREFYARRVRRIIPLAVLVLVSTNLVASQLFSVGRIRQTMTDSLWATFFAANVHFSAIGTDYFQLNRPPSAVEHFWSLSVEEQFYVVWPAALIAAVYVTRRRRAGRGRLVFGLAAGGSLLSLAWGIHVTAANPAAAYFSTTARAWELGFGALVAIAQPRVSTLPSTVRAVASWTGLLGIAAAALLFTAKTPFPGYAALLPVVATALLLGADNPQGGAGAVGVLNNRVAQYVGNTSYSLYLWHFPCIVLASSYFATRSLTYYAVTLLASGGLSVLSFHLLEEPIRRSSWLSQHPTGYRRRRQAEWYGDNERSLTGLLGVGTLVVVLAAGVVLQAPTLPDVSGQYLAAQAPSLLVTSSTPVDAAPSPVQLALQATTWGEFTPGLDGLEHHVVPQWEPGGCLDVDTVERAATCVFGDPQGSRTAFLIGDSVGLSYAPALTGALGPGWRVQVMTHHECPAVTLQTTGYNPSLVGKLFPVCYAHRAFVMDQIAAARPDLVVVSSRSDQFVNFIYGSTASPNQNLTAWQASTQEVLTTVAKSAKRVVLLGGAPAGKDLALCDTPRSHPADCFSQIVKGWGPMSQTEQAAAKAVPGVLYVDPLSWFCYRGTCPAVVDGNAVFADGVHLTDAYSAKLAPLLAKALLAPSV